MYAEQEKYAESIFLKNIILLNGQRKRDKCNADYKNNNKKGRFFIWIHFQSKKTAKVELSGWSNNIFLNVQGFNPKRSYRKSMKNVDPAVYHANVVFLKFYIIVRK